VSQNNLGSNIVIDKSVAGSVFPTSEKDIVFPVLVDGRKHAVHIEGALYGRSVEFRGTIKVDGPVVARGDTKVSPLDGVVFIRSGLTINGSLNVENGTNKIAESIRVALKNASTIIRGDVSINQNAVLRNTIVFGSIRAVNCTLVNSLVLGSCIVEERLIVDSSSIGGYVTGAISFLGGCALIHALGESRNRPLVLPSEVHEIIEDGSVRYYPALRGMGSIINSLAPNQSLDTRLFLETDWVKSTVKVFQDSSSEDEVYEDRWILSIGGRIGDVAKISDSITNISKMLRCGFEFEHYHPAQAPKLLENATVGLTDEEKWILTTVCA